MNELEASMIVRAGAELLETASADPRPDEGYAEVKANLSVALDGIANALRNFDAASHGPHRSSDWAGDLRRVADDLARQ